MNSFQSVKGSSFLIKKQTSVSKQNWTQREVTGIEDILKDKPNAQSRVFGSQTCTASMHALGNY